MILLKDTVRKRCSLCALDGKEVAAEYVHQGIYYCATCSKAETSLFQNWSKNKSKVAPL